MKFCFYKYQCAGNDFILVDNRKHKLALSIDQIRKMCHRKFGIGADGLIQIENHSKLDFNIVYFNSDGSESLCLNGARAAVLLASMLNLVVGSKTVFNTVDGPYSAQILDHGQIKVKMPNVSKFEKLESEFVVHVGVPHYITHVNNILEYQVVANGRKVRYSEKYSPDGINTNFVEELSNNSIFVRTYERGVEDETLSCASASAAAALVFYSKFQCSPIWVKTLGGDLLIEISPRDSSLSEFNIFLADVYLTGPATLVFEGEYEI